MRETIRNKSIVIVVALLLCGAVFIPISAGTTHTTNQEQLSGIDQSTLTIQPSVDLKDIKDDTKDTFPPDQYEPAFLPRVTVVHTDSGSVNTMYAYLASIPMMVFHQDGLVYQSLLVSDHITESETEYILDDWETYLDSWGGAQHINFIGAVSESVKTSVRTQYGVSTDDTTEITGTPIAIANAIADHDWKNSDYVVIAPYSTSLNHNLVESITNAAAIASLYNAPVLFTDPSTLIAETQDTIVDLDATQAILVEIGDTLDGTINTQLAALGVTVTQDLTTEASIIGLMRTLSGKSTLCSIIQDWQGLPAAYAGARYGGYVLYLPSSIASKSKDVGDSLADYTPSYYKLEKPEELPADYKSGEAALAQNFYNWLTPLGGNDPDQLETVITFNTQPYYDTTNGFDVYFDRAISGDPSDLTNPGAVTGRMPLDYLGNIALINRDTMYRATIFANPRPMHVTLAMNAYEVWHAVDSGSSTPDNWGLNHVINEIFGWPYRGWVAANSYFPWDDIQTNPPGLSPLLTPGPGAGPDNDPGQFASFNEYYETVFHSGADAGTGSHPAQPGVSNIGFVADLNAGSAFLYFSCHGGGTSIAVRSIDNGVAQDSSDNVPWGSSYWPSTDGRVYDGSAGGSYSQTDLDSDIVNVHGAMTAYNACDMANGKMNEVLLEHGGSASIGSYTSVSFVGSGWWWNLFVHLVTHEGYTVGEAAAYASARVADLFTPGSPTSGNEDTTLNYVLYGDPNLPFMQHDWTSPEPNLINVLYGGHKPDKPPRSFIVTIDPTSIPVSVESTIDVNVLDDQTLLPVVTDVSINGWGINELQTTDDQGDTSFTITPPYGEELMLTVEKEDYDTYETSIAVTGATSLDGDITALIPSLGVSDVLAPTIEGQIEATSTTSDTFTLAVTGCGVDDSTTTTTGTAALLVTPTILGTISAAILKEGYVAYETTIPVLTLHLSIEYTPTTLTVGHQSTLEVTVSCTESTSLIEDVTVSILGGGLDESAQTNSVGVATFTVIPTVDGTATVTATHTGFADSQTTIDILKADMTVETQPYVLVNQQTPLDVWVNDSFNGLPLDNAIVSIAGCGIGITEYTEQGALTSGEHHDIFVDVGSDATYISGYLTWEGTADIDMKLYDPSGTQVDSSTSTSSSEFVEANDPVAGTWRIEVYSYSGATSLFNLDITVEYGAGATGETTNGVATIVIQPTSTGVLSVTATHDGYYDGSTTLDCVTGPSGAIEGVVTDGSTSDLLEGIIVELYSAGIDPYTNDPAFETNTNSVGYYTISGVPVGDYTVFIEAFSYEPYLGAATILDAQTTTHDIALTPSFSYMVSGDIRDANSHQLLASNLIVYREDTSEEVVNIEVPTGHYSIQLIPYTYRFRVAADEHLSHEEVISITGTTTLNFLLTPAVFNDDVEDGADGWTHSTGSSASDLWHISTRSYHSQGHAWYCGSESTGQYESSMDDSLISPAIDLTNLNTAVLTFWHQYTFESTTYAWDGSDVEISVDGGAWQQIIPVGGYPDTEYASSNSAFPQGTPVYAHSSNGWVQAEFDLSAYVDHSIRLRFRFGSDGSVATYEGWFIDDFTIFGEISSPQPDLIPTELVFSDDEPWVGDTIQIDATIYNGGTDDAADILVRFYSVSFEGVETAIGTDTITALAQEATDTASISWQTTAGYHLIKVIVDPDNSIQELNENNNELADELIVGSTNIKPTCSITYPETGVVLTGAITVTGSADDTDGTISSVWVKIDDGPWEQAATTKEWSYIWDTTTADNGFIDIYSLSYDGIDISETAHQVITVDNFEEEYYLQWSHNYGSSISDARYQGAQPIGDCDNDGDNEFLIGGRDGQLHVMKWNPLTETYEEQALITETGGSGDNPGGYSIGDVDNDGLNEIAVAWDYRFSAFKWNGNSYVQLGATWTGHGTDNTYDCYIGDFDNDGDNEVILADDPSTSSDPEITVLHWNAGSNAFVEETNWNYPGGTSITPMAWVADVDNDGLNEIVCVPGYDLVVLDWSNKAFTATTIGSYSSQTYACVCGDTNGNGIPEIALGLEAPTGYIYEWDGDSYEQLWTHTWTGEEPIIEAVAIGDADDDGIQEIAFGTNLVHILQWDGATYPQEAVLPTAGELAPLAIGDLDNDGYNEVTVGNVAISPYYQWVFKHRNPTQPTCSITFPSDGTTVSGTLIITGEAQGVDTGTVYIRINDNAWEEATFSTKVGWTYEWDTTLVENGWYTIYVGAYTGERYSAITTITIHVLNINILCGDANDDGIINVSDAVYIINYVFVPGFPAPDPLCSADVNGDDIVNISDAVYLINYVFVPGSPAPQEGCCI
jgi:hypothetical protein